MENFLPTLWFILIAVLWIGYLFLEGFDLGVGMLLKVLGKNDKERRTMINTIGPVWDGNEVWLLTAGGATFAAFPYWYASLFSALYIPLVVVLLGLIMRGVAIDYRGKGAGRKWRDGWDNAMSIGSLLAAFGIGAGLALTTTGLPINAHGDRDGNPFSFLNFYAIIGGLAVVGFCLVHAAIFLALKTDGEIRKKSRAFALKFLPIFLIPIVLWVLVIQFQHANKIFGYVLILLAVAAVVFAWLQLKALDDGKENHEGKAFIGLGAFLVAGAASIFYNVYPVVLPSTIDPAFNLTVTNAASTHYTLTVMSIVALIGVPVVLAYQIWTYWVFRKRISAEMIPDEHIIPEKIREKILAKD
ncbi:MAG: cytochrome d ubiquinol oxidase subunit II [Micrococcaceae bacterium]